MKARVARARRQLAQAMEESVVTVDIDIAHL
jgi:hypothetical protein